MRSILGPPSTRVGHISTKIVNIYTSQTFHMHRTCIIRVCCSKWHERLYLVSNIYQRSKNMDGNPATRVLHGVHSYICRRRGLPNLNFRHSTISSCSLQSIQDVVFYMNPRISRVTAMGSHVERPRVSKRRASIVLLRDSLRGIPRQQQLRPSTFLFVSDSHRLCVHHTSSFIV